MLKRIFGGFNKYENLSQTLLDLTNAQSTSEKHRIIEAHPELLSPDATDLMTEIIRYSEGNKEVAQRLVSSQKLLQYCKEMGVERAFDTINRTDHMNRIVHEAQSLIKSKHFQQCAELLQQEIRKISSKTHPLEWSIYHYHLGNSLLFAYGISPEKAEQMIEAYQQVFGISTSRNLQARLGAKHALTHLYLVRLQGDRAQNIEQVIDLCHEILNMISPETNLDLWFKTKAQLAKGYLERMQGNRRENLGLAVSIFSEISEMSPDDSMPSSFVLESVIMPWGKARDELGGMHVFHASQNTHKHSLMMLIYAQTWPEAKRVIEANPELLSDEIDSLLVKMIEQTLDEGMAANYQECLLLLRRCRLVGLEIAFYEKQGGSVAPELLQQVLWAPIQTIYLAIEEHPEFLTDSTLRVLEAEMDALIKGVDINGYYMIKARLLGIHRLLSRCREIGTDEAIAERMLEEIPFPLPDDAPEELKQAQARIASVTASFSPEARAKLYGFGQ